MDRSKKAAEARWLLLIHQLPPKPAYFRVKIGRHLSRLGAAALKNSVYALPATDQAREDFAWVEREIAEGGGESFTCEARFYAGLKDERIEALFNAARNADYEELAAEARRVQRALPRGRGLSDERRAELEADLSRLSKRLSDIVAIDYCGASHRIIVEGLLRGLTKRLADDGGPAPSQAPRPVGEMRGRTWVTRKNIHVDRIASAWAIRRFIDPDAQFKFVAGNGYEPAPGEQRFDMFEAEFTHEGDRCTFEVLLERFGLADPALVAIAEIIHDIDLKDEKFSRPERAGVERLVVGLAVSEPDDEARVARGAALFSALYAAFSRKLS
jgi:hypothetical protein